jgi:hypothetical protein
VSICAPLPVAAPAVWLLLRVCGVPYAIVNQFYTTDMEATMDAHSGRLVTPLQLT